MRTNCCAAVTMDAAQRRKWTFCEAIIKGANLCQIL